MDRFGIGAALLAFGSTLEGISRRTGRTTRLVDSLRNGDRVVCFDVAQAAILRGRVRDAGLRVDVVVMAIASPRELLNLAPVEGATVFDHGWVTAHYRHVVSLAAAEIAGAEEVHQRPIAKPAGYVPRPWTGNFVGRTLKGDVTPG